LRSTASVTFLSRANSDKSSRNSPRVFAESLQASDDYLHTPYYATFIRLLRLAAFAAAVFADIRAYREAHQAEYEEFLREEQAKGDAENEPNKKAEQIGA